MMIIIMTIMNYNSAASTAAAADNDNDNECCRFSSINNNLPIMSSTWVSMSNGSALQCSVQGGMKPCSVMSNKINTSL